MRPSGDHSRSKACPLFPKRSAGPSLSIWKWVAQGVFLSSKILSSCCMHARDRPPPISKSLPHNQFFRSAGVNLRKHAALHMKHQLPLSANPLHKVSKHGARVGHGAATCLTSLNKKQLLPRRGGSQWMHTMIAKTAPHAAGCT